MTAKLQLKRLAIVAGLSLMSLSATFNAANGTPHTPPVPENISTPIQESAATLNVQVETIFNDIHSLATERSKLPDYKPDADLELHQAADRLIELVGRGANPNHIEKDGLKLFSATNMNAFQASIILATEIKRPDLVRAFLRAGASPTIKAPDNWCAMDYAVSSLLGAQQDSVGSVETAISVLQLLLNAGGKLSDAEEMNKLSEGKIQGFGDLAMNAVGLTALYQSGLVTADEYEAVIVGKPNLSRAIRNMTTINADTLKKYGATRMDYHDAPPGGPEPYAIVKNDTLWSLATRFQQPMGAATHNEALKMLAERNNIVLDATGNSRVLNIGETILIPVQPHIQIEALSPNKGMTLRQVAKILHPAYYKKQLSVDEVAAELAVINGLDKRRMDDPALFANGERVLVPLANDSHNQWPQLTPPAHYKGGREVDLMVIEPEDDHGKNTYRVATGTAYSINPKVDLSNFHSWSELLLDFPSKQMSDMLRMLLNAEGSPIQDRVLFSHSMAYKLDEPKADRVRNAKSFDSVAYERIRLFLGQLDRARPIIFNAAGNFWPKEGRYIQSYQATHSPRAVMIGAAGQYRTDLKGSMNFVMAPYTTHSADICAPLPKYLNKQMEGTSFSTPLTAAYYRQMSEWYGDILSFEEIMAAALMTADRDILDYDNVATLGKNPLVQPDKYNTHPALFRSNGGRLPNHERCGAGILNPERWQAALNTMLELKTSPGKDAGRTMTVYVGTPRITPPNTANGQTEYVYRVPVPAAMTLGKLTFLLPQDTGRHSEIVVRTPSGFEKHMPKSLSDVISTFAFAYEDVHAGQMIEIRTTEPLGPTAGIMLRGHAPGNAIAALRNHLAQSGVLPEANRTMEGNVVTGPLEPITVLQDTPAKPQPAPASAEPDGPDMPTPDLPTPEIPAPVVPQNHTKPAPTRPFQPGGPS